MADADKAAREWQEMALVGVVARPHGIRGQVIVNPETDFPETRYRPGAEFCILRDGQVRRVTVTTCRMHQGRPVIGIAGIESMTEARLLAGCQLRVPAATLAPLPAGSYYRHDLVGCVVETVSGAGVGTVRAVEGTEARSRLVVDGAFGEVLIPVASPICVSIDIAARKVVVDPPDGLLDLNRRRDA